MQSTVERAAEVLERVLSPHFQGVTVAADHIPPHERNLTVVLRADGKEDARLTVYIENARPLGAWALAKARHLVRTYPQYWKSCKELETAFGEATLDIRWEGWAGLNERVLKGFAGDARAEVTFKPDEGTLRLTLAGKRPEEPNEHHNDLLVAEAIELSRAWLNAPTEQSP